MVIGSCDVGYHAGSSEDWEQQVDECLVLQAVVGMENFRVTSEDRGPPGRPDSLLAITEEEAGMLRVQGRQGRLLKACLLAHIELPEAGMQLTVDRECQDANVDSASVESSGLRVNFLPPISLHMSLPLDYPSSAPPDLRLTAPWLSDEQLSSLWSALMDQWEEQGPGMPIGFTWLTWLQTDALVHLGLEGRLSLRHQWPPAPATGRLAGSQGLNTPGIATPETCSAEDNNPEGTISGVMRPAAVHSQAFSPEANRRRPNSRAAVRSQRNWPESDRCEATGPGDLDPAGFSPEPNSSGGKSFDSSSCGNRIGSATGLEHAHLAAGSSEANGNGGSCPEAEPTACARDSRCSGRGPDGSDALLMRLLAYDASRKAEAFDKSVWTCRICMEDVLGAQCLRPALCDHFYCCSCVATLCKTAVAEKAIDRLKCPEPDCHEPLQMQRVKALLSEEEIQRWEEADLEMALSTMSDATYCPRCTALCFEDQDAEAQCGLCFFVFCTLCREARHPISQCIDPETRMRLLREKMAGRRVDEAQLDILRRREQDLLSQARIKETSKRCPKCKAATEKTEGCNKMVCPSCYSRWCWRCVQVIDDCGHNGYDHFSNGRCVLFDDSEIARFNAMFAADPFRDWGNEVEQPRYEERQIVVQPRRQARPMRRVRQAARACPRCGQLNLKDMNNNHMRCWSCNVHFCYLCGMVFVGRSAGRDHFKPTTCPQHSYD